MEPNLKFVKSCKQAGYKFEELFKKRLCLKLLWSVRTEYMNKRLNNITIFDTKAV